VFAIHDVHYNRWLFPVLCGHGCGNTLLQIDPKRKLSGNGWPAWCGHQVSDL